MPQNWNRPGAPKEACCVKTATACVNKRHKAIFEALRIL
jgi:hypothetical protein